jgi:FAD/FMN-containing dehydrogenase
MDLIARLREVVGADSVKVGDDVPRRNWQDEAGLPPVAPVALLVPRTVEELAAALAICHAVGQPVVTQGGLTGLAGGARPAEGEVALSTEKLVGVEEIDPSAGTLTALAGTPLEVIQKAAEAAGFMCGIDLGARGSCTIGGNVATNAGGNQVMRYGMTRRNVLGLEVVLADGQIVRSLNKMMKNNAGYDWTQLFIGSEGTLGVVTRVVLALHPLPRGILSALLAVNDTESGIRALRRLEQTIPAGLLTFEAMWHEFYEIATGTFRVIAPLERGRELYILVADAVVAQSSRERAGLWALRESVYDYKREFGPTVGFDISIPLDRMADAIAAYRVAIPAAFPGALWVAFGHLADSNIHLQVVPRPWTPETAKAVDRLVYSEATRLGGSVSAEHGIGTLKRPYLALTRTPPELALMATVKQALDPKAILNRGRVL